MQQWQRSNHYNQRNNHDHGNSLSIDHITQTKQRNRTIVSLFHGKCCISYITSKYTRRKGCDGWSDTKPRPHQYVLLCATLWHYSCFCSGIVRPCIEKMHSVISLLEKFKIFMFRYVHRVIHYITVHRWIIWIAYYITPFVWSVWWAFHPLVLKLVLIRSTLVIPWLLLVP